MSTQQDLYNIDRDVYNLNTKLNEAYLMVLHRLPLSDFEKMPYKDEIAERAKDLEESRKSLSIAQPGTLYAKETIERIYTTLRKIDRLVSGSKENKKFRDYNWKDGLDSLYKELDRWRADVKPYLDRAKEDVGKSMQYLEELGREGKLRGSPVQQSPQRKAKKQAATAADEAADVTAAGKAVAMVTIVALGFTIINGLNNLSAASSGAAAGASTGFFMLPGTLFVSSMQMVLFMLASIIVIIYLFGKAASEW